VAEVRLGGNVDPDDPAYEASEFAAKHGLTIKAAKIIMVSNGPSRVACDAAARAFLAAIAARRR
jgi:hypothetical protein